MFNILRRSCPAVNSTVTGRADQHVVSNIPIVPASVYFPGLGIERGVNSLEGLETTFISVHVYLK